MRRFVCFLGGGGLFLCHWRGGGGRLWCDPLSEALVPAGSPELCSAGAGPLVGEREREAGILKETPKGEPPICELMLYYKYIRTYVYIIYIHQVYCCIHLTNTCVDIVYIYIHTYIDT